MLKKILFVIGAFIAAILIIAAFQPSEFKVTRTLTINATPAEIFPQVNDLKAWSQWSPWEKIDPGMQKIFEGASAGEGAVYAWKGNHDVGAGKMTITQSQLPEKIVIHMDFLEPMPGIATTEFEFKPVEAGTMVSWSMAGRNNYLSRIICLFMNSDKIIGGYFEKGLKDLKSLVETTKKSN